MNISHFSRIMNVHNHFILDSFTIRATFNPKWITLTIAFVTQNAHAMVVKRTILNKFIFLRFAPYTRHILITNDNTIDNKILYIIHVYVHLHVWIHRDGCGYGRRKAL